MDCITSIGNYYGNLFIKKTSSGYYWIIENYDTIFDVLDECDQISEQLYKELLNKLNN